MRGLVWLRRDLRLHDHPALTAAAGECEDVLPLFVFDEPLLASRTFGGACVNFMLGSLQELASGLAKRGCPLLWRRGEPVDLVVRAVREWNADVVYWNRDYEPDALRRDRAVERQLAELGVTVKTFKDHVVFEATDIRSATGDPLQRYSAYRTRWWASWHAMKPTALPAPSRLESSHGSRPPAAPLPTAEELGYEPLTPWIEPGEAAALKRLDRFVNGPLHRYVDGRNQPALDGSSRLSPHFRFGTLSARTAIQSALGVLAKGGRVSRPDVLTWIDELIWREFFQQVLTAFPRVADGAFRNSSVPPSREPGPEYDRLFEAWRTGRTGYPIVDAGMRQLNSTGWMHNRVRMIVASFLIKDLRLDWRSGERYFMHHLLDADLAANNGNWQWCAGTGTDAMRGYRIFNPVLQGKKFDPDGSYVRHYVPELARVPAARIHEPWMMSESEQACFGCRPGLDYPAPIIDHATARAEYLALGERVKASR
ncbi:MAG: deoxyribodipyrimidine photo-lyase [Nitrospira sp.]